MSRYFAARSFAARYYAARYIHGSVAAPPPPPGDVTPPTVAVTAPAESQIVAGTVALFAFATDNVTVASVEFAINGVYQAPITVAPYTMPWDTTLEDDGPIMIGARATDAASNVGYATDVMVLVQNTPSSGDVDNLGKLVSRFGRGRARQGARR